jgi:hypothetical protein
MHAAARYRFMLCYLSLRGADESWDMSLVLTLPESGIIHHEASPQFTRKMEGS